MSALAEFTHYWAEDRQVRMHECVNVASHTCIPPTFGSCSSGLCRYAKVMAHLQLILTESLANPHWLQCGLWWHSYGQRTSSNSYLLVDFYTCFLNHFFEASLLSLLKHISTEVWYTHIRKCTTQKCTAWRVTEGNTPMWHCCVGRTASSPRGPPSFSLLLIPALPPLQK